MFTASSVCQEKSPLTKKQKAAKKYFGDSTINFEVKEKIFPSAQELKDIVSQQPVVAIMIMSDFVWNYKGDYVSESECPTTGKIFHSVVIVGYSEEPNQKCLKGHWIVKNSFGKNWGGDGDDKGYMKLCIVDEKGAKGTCGI